MARSGDSHSPLHFSEYATQPQSPLLGLPAESRTEILKLVLKREHPVPILYHWLPEDQIIDPWPAILDTCRQLRDESLEVFLSSNTFRAHSTGSPEKLDELIAWMRKVKDAPPNAKKSIQFITIDVCDAAVNRETSGRLTCEPKLHFDSCDRLLRAITESGLRADQLRWRGFEIGREEPDLTACWTAARINGAFYYYVGQNLSNKYVLTPLLHWYNLYDEHNPPKDILERAKEDHWRNILVCYWRQLQSSDTLSWKGSLPEEWYSFWVTLNEKERDGTHSSDGERSQIA